jgi:PAS domain S-box-containing protein
MKETEVNFADRKTILLVEDESFIALDKQMRLEECGYEVILAQSGEKAVAMAGGALRLHMILMDIDLGEGMDGIQAAKKILEKLDIPIIFLSSHTETEMIEKTGKITSYGYVLKTSGMALLVATIKMAFTLFDANARTRAANVRLEATLGALAASEMRYRRLFETAKDGILILDAETGKIVDVNPYLVEMLGYTKEQFIEKAIWEIGAFKDLVANKDNFVELQQKEYVRYEDMPLVTARGEKVEVEFISNVYLVDCRKVIQCSIRDISDRKIAEELIGTLLAEKELILKEVHHRIKNNMSTIASLLSLQAEALANAEARAALKDAESRVQSMMVLYNKLYLSAGFRSVSLLEYLPSLVSDILDNFPNRASIKVARVIGNFSLDARELQPLGIIVNELLTNIMKYAFTGMAMGMITVSALQEGKTVCLSIEDNGHGMPEHVDFSNSPGFGLMLVGLLTRQLEGKIRIERAAGTKIVLEFEAA